MAIIQISKIQQRSGNLVDLPQLDEAEFGWASDAKRLFIGKTTPNENIEVLTSYSEISFSQLDGAIGNLNINPLTLENGQPLVFDGADWTNRGGIAGGLITLGDVSNVRIDGGSIGYILQTDGTGNLSWAPNGVIVAYIQNVTKANPAVVTTVDENFFVDGAQITITNAQGMVDLNGQTYYANVLTSNTFSLYSDSGLSSPVNSSAYNAYAYTSVTATTVSTNIITVGNSSPFTVNQPVRFLGNLSTSGISNNVTYYVSSKPNGTSLKIATSGDGNVSNVVALQTTSGLTANVYQEGGRIVGVFGSGASFGVAEGTNTTVQFNNNNLLDGSANFTFNTATNVLTLTGNANVGNLVSSGIVSGTRLLSNVSNGTTPIQVVSTTRVPNLNVSYANVSDFGAVTTQNTGTFYPVLASGNTTANYALASNANLSFNAATGLLTTTLLSVVANANVGNLGASGLIVATGNVSGGNLTTTGNLSVTGNANVGNLGSAGNLSAANVIGNLYGNGAAISAITGANVTGQVGFAAVANSVAVANVTGIGNIATTNLDGNSSNILYGNGSFASPVVLYNNSNVATFLAAFGSNTLSTTGNANVGNLNASSQIIATGNVTGGNLTTAGQVAATGNVTGGNLTTGGKLTVTGDANVTGNINATGNVVASSNVTVVGSVNVTTNVTANNIATGNYANVGLDLNVSGNASIAGNATVSGNITTSSNVSANFLTLTNTANIGANINVSGNARVTGNSNVTGALTVGGTANITGTINAGNIVATGNIVSANASLGNVATANYFAGDGSLLTNINVGPISSIQNGTSNVVVDSSSTVRVGVAGTANVIVVQGIGPTINGAAAITGNLSAGNISTAGQATVTGNVSAGNISTGRITASGNISVGGQATVTGNLSSGNLSTGNITASGNVSASYFIGDGSQLTNIPVGNINGFPSKATFAETANTVVRNAQPNITSVGTLTSLTSSGNITAPNFNGNLVGNANVINLLANAFTATGSASVSNLTASGSITATGNISANNITTVNAISVGTNANISGNLVVSGFGIINGNLSTNSNLAVASNATVSGTLSAVNAGVTTLTALNAKITNLRDNSNYLITKFDNDGTMAANSASSLPTQQAVVAYVANSTTNGLGYNQTWQNVTGRTLGASYNNDTGKPIMVYVKAAWSLQFNGALTAQVNSVEVASFSAHTGIGTVNFLVPPGASYVVSANVAATLSQWSELK